MEEKALIHNNQFHLIGKEDICKAVMDMVETLHLAAGSTDGFDLYKVVQTYFVELDKRHAINQLLNIPEATEYYAEQEQIREVQQSV